MYELGMEKISSPTDALTLADALGVDGVIVGSITQYDPYFPPRMGMAIQLYTREGPRSGLAFEEVDPGALARAGKPFELSRMEDLEPQVSIVRIVDANQDDVKKRLKLYARDRSSDLEPYGWKKWTTRQNYPRFVAHEIIGELLAIEAKQVVVQSLGE